MSRKLKRQGVMQVIDTLVAAGAERVAVNLANGLPRDRYISHLCTTREDGPLDRAVAPDVARLRLRRTSSFDFAAVRRLVEYIRAHNIRVLHAHSTAIFIARLAAAFKPHPAVIWHAHYGRYTEERWPWRYRLATSGIAGIVTVNQELADWCGQRLRVEPRSIWYVANPVFAGPVHDSERPELPGVPGSRIICVANFRREKDHFTLLRAMTAVVKTVPEAHLMIAGKCNDAEYLQWLRDEIPALGLSRHVTILGERHDIPAILRQCDIGVLSSVSEGLPVSLLEYGKAGLAAIATEAGQCPEVLDHGKAGILIPHSDPQRLAIGLINLLQQPQTRRALGARFQQFVNQKFNAERIIEQFCGIYDTVSDRALRPAFDLIGSID